ncbi:cysteine hydrolase family protein [Alkalibacterium pelagium]|jgi:nicotinamidase-related amidase|uniref:Nicotinamidase-related amidase n=1 Tax=Alkalibacterium pelagium TaxID=426702 RepID=A0A1H7HID5_9LACT|nr:isochorismatase family cysteine hydrolase [Alkalibacterium pelagium]GEN50431.1 putative isochorismatase family protein PncA [Alkalibacterium pelagium]SEK50029.1 Nicotinamidase-related amidase [Alkalibacterium pelagium]
MKKALINIDYTNDFVAEDGALTCGEPGQAIHDRVLELTKQFYDEGDYVAFTIDCHEEGDDFHPESNLFPPHNIKGTAGRHLYGKLEDYYQSIKEKDTVYYSDKTRYSAFQGTDLELKLRERGITELHLIGVCTDICVLHTAVDAYNKGFEIVVYKDAVASFNQAGHEWALSHFEQTIGARII